MSKQVKVILAVVLLILAAGAIAWNLGVFGGAANVEDPSKRPQTEGSQPPAKGGSSRLAPGAAKQAPK